MNQFPIDGGIYRRWINIIKSYEINHKTHASEKIYEVFIRLFLTTGNVLSLEEIKQETIEFEKTLSYFKEFYWEYCPELHFNLKSEQFAYLYTKMKSLLENERFRKLYISEFDYEYQENFGEDFLFD